LGFLNTYSYAIVSIDLGIILYPNSRISASLVKDIEKIDTIGRINTRLRITKNIFISTLCIILDFMVDHSSNLKSQGLI
jgi:hypothetical protein